MAIAARLPSLGSPAAGRLALSRPRSAAAASRIVAPRRAVIAAMAAGGSVVPAATIVGAGRVGLALQAMGDGADVMVKRGEPVPAGPAGPIFVCTRNDDLEAVVEATPPARRKDLVFLQNGMMEPWMAEKSLAGQATQCLVYFAVAKKGEAPTDGKTDMDPDGLTSVYGRWADATAARFARAGLSCAVLEEAPFRARMFEKLIWISAFMLVGAAHPGATVGDVESTHRAEVDALIGELAAATSAAAGVAFAPQLEERLRAYARSVAHFPTAVKEFKWRNGYFYGLSLAAAAAGKADPCPRHTALLKIAKAI